MYHSRFSVHDFGVFSSVQRSTFDVRGVMIATATPQSINAIPPARSAVKRSSRRRAAAATPITGTSSVNGATIDVGYLVSNRPQIA